MFKKRVLETKHLQVEHLDHLDQMTQNRYHVFDANTNIRNNDTFEQSKSKIIYLKDIRLPEHKHIKKHVVCDLGYWSCDDEK